MVKISKLHSAFSHEIRHLVCIMHISYCIIRHFSSIFAFVFVRSVKFGLSFSFPCFDKFHQMGYTIPIFFQKGWVTALKLSLKMIALELTQGNVHIASERLARPDQMRLSSLALWNPNDVWDYSVCYCMDAQQIKPDFRCPENIALILLGRADPEQFSGMNADILIWDVSRKEMSFREQFNQINRIFWSYQEIEVRLLRRMMDGGTLQELVTFGETLFRNPLLLLDAGFSLLVRSRRKNPLDWELSGGSQIPSLPAETVEQIRISSEFRSRELNGGVFSLSDEVLNCRALFIQIQRDQSVYYLAVLETGQPLTEAHEQLLQLYAEFVFYALRSRRFSSARTMYFDELIGRMLGGETVETSEINRNLQSLRWKHSDQFICFVLETDLWQHKDIDFYSICRMVETKFPDTIPFCFKDQIVCITNLDRAGIRRDVFLHLLAPYVRDHLFRAGVSYAFSDFSALSSYHRQAIAALEFGKQKKPDEWSHRFEKYALDYFTRYGTSRMEARHLCHPDLILLEEFDRENGTNLLRTLQVYLNCGQNATTASAELYIHRNTLYQRMSKIESLIHAKLSDPATRLYMQISFSIMDFTFPDQG